MRNNNDFKARLKEARGELANSNAAVELTAQDRTLWRASRLASITGRDLRPGDQEYTAAFCVTDCEALESQLGRLSYFDAWVATSALEGFAADLVRAS